MSDVAENLRAVRARIDEAARRAGRNPESVRLLAVSKKKPTEAIVEAYEAGQRDFGENYVQELTDKAEALAHLQGVRWHMIGHLQRNKAGKVAKIVTFVHTVDSVALAERLGRVAGGSSRASATDDDRLRVLVEVNVSGESAKSGCGPEDLPRVLDAIEAEPSLWLRGLMTMPPLTPDPADSRPFFDALRELASKHGGTTRLPELSMGMSRDLEHAVLAGATWVRVGTAIFGAREG